MKFIFPLSFLLLIFQADLFPTDGKNAQAYNTKIHVQDSLTWLDHFKQFRDAVYQSDKAKVKSFFDFPVKVETNDIWQLLYAGNEKALNALPEKPKPFTEPDFDKYYTRLFSSAFINTLLKVKTAELYKANHTESAAYKPSDSATYKMIADLNKKDKRLSLQLYSEVLIRDDAEDFKDETSIFYVFSISGDGQLKFKAILIAD